MVANITYFSLVIKKGNFLL